MKRLIKFFLILAVLVAALALPLSATAEGDKVTICHKPGTPAEVTIEVSANALDAHLAHGDRIGDCGGAAVLTCPFEATIPVIGPDPVMFVLEFPAPTAGFAWDYVISPSSEQPFRYYANSPGATAPPLEGMWQITVFPWHVGWPGYTSLWDIYIAKLNPGDLNFDMNVSCTQVPLP